VGCLVSPRGSGGVTNMIIIKVGRLTSFKGSSSMLGLMFILELTCFRFHRKELQNSICLGYKMRLLVKKETSSSEKTKR